jgi:hypothetical protein
MSASLIACAFLLTACTSPARKAAERDASVANWISRICALPANERDAEIKRVQEKDGITIVCPDR